jgi:hypothetical protein
MKRTLKAALGAAILVAGTVTLAGTAQADPPGCGGAYTGFGGGGQCDFDYTPAGHTHCVHVIAPFVPNIWNCNFVPN